MIIDFDEMQAILSLRPTTGAGEWSLRNNIVTWVDPTITMPTDSEIEAEMVRLKTLHDAKEYARNRKTEYPDIGDQLDSLFHAGVFPADMTTALQAVKDKYPKE